MTTTLSGTAVATRWLDANVERVRHAVTSQSDPAGRADAVADVLRGRLPTVGVLDGDQLRGSAERYQQHVLHVDPDGLFSITALVWRPGQCTPVHDHVCWCTVGVLAGVEHEVTYRVRSVNRRGTLVRTGWSDAYPGDVSSFAPPGDIHHVQNSSDRVAVSLHVYGADISTLGTSVRRVYTLPQDQV